MSSSKNKSSGAEEKLTSWVKQTGLEVIYSYSLILIAVLVVVTTLIFFIRVSLILSKNDFEPQAGQLLNRIQIEQAATLLQEETILYTTQD